MRGLLNGESLEHTSLQYSNANILATRAPFEIELEAISIAFMRMGYEEN